MDTIEIPILGAGEDNTHWTRRRFQDRVRAIRKLADVEGPWAEAVSAFTKAEADEVGKQARRKADHDYEAADKAEEAAEKEKNLTYRDVGVRLGFFRKISKRRDALYPILRELTPEFLKAVTKLFGFKLTSTPLQDNGPLERDIRSAIAQYVSDVIERDPVYRKAAEEQEKAVERRSEASQAREKVYEEYNRLKYVAEVWTAHRDRLIAMRAKRVTLKDPKVRKENEKIKAAQSVRQNARVTLDAWKEGRVRIEGFPTWVKGDR